MKDNFWIASKGFVAGALMVFAGMEFKQGGDGTWTGIISVVLAIGIFAIAAAQKRDQ